MPSGWSDPCWPTCAEGWHTPHSAGGGGESVKNRIELGSPDYGLALAQAEMAEMAETSLDQ